MSELLKTDAFLMQIHEQDILYYNNLLEFVLCTTCAAYFVCIKASLKNKPVTGIHTFANLLQWRMQINPQIVIETGICALKPTGWH